MIKKLKTKVFLILMISISTVVLGVITIFAILNYNNTFNVASLAIDRFNNIPQKPSKDLEDLKKEETNIDYSNMYYFFIEKGEIVSSLGEMDSDIERYAIEVSKKHEQSGIIGNYIFKTRRAKEGGVIVILMEDSNTIKRLKGIFVLAIIISLILLLIIYIISKKLTNIIVKPVEETIEKQKQFISDASHELKTPLAVIEANVDVLESQIGKNKWMEYIQSEITSMDKLINNLLFLAKVENTSELQLSENFNVSEQVNLVSSMFESIAYERKVVMNYNIKDNIMINANKEDIKQVLSILIDNAIMHTNHVECCSVLCLKN